MILSNGKNESLSQREGFLNIPFRWSSNIIFSNSVLFNLGISDFTIFNIDFLDKNVKLKINEKRFRNINKK